MSNLKIQKFSVIGISVRTTNENGQSGVDIPALWNRFMSDGILEKIPNKTDHSIYCIYTAYEKDHTRPYTTIIGCKVENTALIPNGMVEKTIETGNYSLHIAKGNLSEGIVFNEWTKIWNSNLVRAFIADFEVYGQKANNPVDAEVDIFVGVR